MRLDLRVIPDYGPDFDGYTAVQTWVTCGDLYRFFKTLRLNEPITADHFLGFAKRAVRYSFSARENFALIRKLTPAFHLSFIAQSLEPSEELASDLPDVIRR